MEFAIIALLALLAVAVILWWFTRNQLLKTAQALEKERSAFQQQVQHIKTYQLHQHQKRSAYLGLIRSMLNDLSIANGNVQQITSLWQDELAEGAQRMLKSNQQTLYNLKISLQQLVDLVALEQGDVVIHPQPVSYQDFLRIALSELRQKGFQLENLHFTVEQKLLSLNIDQPKGLLLLLSMADLMGTAKHIDSPVHLQHRATKGQEGSIHITLGVGSLNTNAEEISQSPQWRVANDYAEMLGGKVTVQDQDASGISLTMEMPVAVSTIDQDTLPTQRDNNAIPNKVREKTVLIVEDYAPMRLYMEKLLEMHYVVETATNGQEALEVLEKRNVDLIISDLLMPEMSGIELRSALLENTHLRQLPFIMLSAQNNPTTKFEALELGINDYLTKPFDPQEFLLRVKNALELEPIQSTNTIQSSSAGNYNEQFLQQARHLAEKQLHDPHYTVEALAEDMGLSKRSLYRKMKDEFGLTPSAFLKQLRMQKAHKMLKAQAFATVSDISANVGYTSNRTFSDHFKKHFGIRPSIFLEKGNE